MTRLYLIRHAEAEGNLYRIAQGQYDSTITERGYRQIEALSARFAEIPIDAVYSSDLYRTCVTAGAIYLPKHLPLQKRENLREICVGEWEQKTWGEIQRTDEEQLVNFNCHLDRWFVPGAETIAQVRDRVLGEIRKIARENEGKTVAIFSHGCSLRIVLGTLQGYSIAELGQTSHGDNTAVSLVEAEGDSMRVVFRDDASHLQATGTSTFAKQTWWKRPNALEAGLYFQQLQLPEDAGWLAACVKEAWTAQESARAYDEKTLLAEAGERPTWVAQKEEEPVGVLQLHPEKEARQGRGWISLYCMTASHRRRGLGIQLLGQAVQYYRPLNRTRLCLALGSEQQEATRFFEGYGFTPVETGEDGRTVWEKDISYREL